MTQSGLAERDPRFFYVRFNIGLQYALLGRSTPSLRAFRELLDRHGDHKHEIIDLFARSRSLHKALENRSEFAEALVTSCPELFQVGDGSDDARGETKQDGGV